MTIAYSVTNRRHPKELRSRPALTLSEMIVALVVLISIMTFVTSLCFQINRLWKDVGHHRVAINELTNQLEHLTLLGEDEITKQLESIEPSQLCQRTLKEPTIEGEVVTDSLGSRVTLRINWKRANPGKPMELSGWIISEATK